MSLSATEDEQMSSFMSYWLHCRVKWVLYQQKTLYKSIGAMNQPFIVWIYEVVIIICCNLFYYYCLVDNSATVTLYFCILSPVHFLSDFEWFHAVTTRASKDNGAHVMCRLSATVDAVNPDEQFSKFVSELNLILHMCVWAQ